MSIAEQPGATATADARIAELEAKVEQLLARLETQTAAPVAAARVPPTHTQPAGSRRNLLKLAAGAAAGGTALAMSKGAGPVAAADGDPVRVGQTTTQGTAADDAGRVSTVVQYVNSEGPRVPGIEAATFDDANIFTVRDDPTEPPPFEGDAARSSYPAALGGYGYSQVSNGIYGYTAQGGYGIAAVGGGAGAAGVLARGSRANIELFPSGDAPVDRLDAHTVGELLTDGAGNLWYCVASGSPGTWQKISGTMTAGAFHAVTPFRVYDSREALPDDGLAGSTDYSVSVADARDVETYAVTLEDAVPEGATAISANVVAINAVGGGFATINPGGDGSVGAAALNWGEGQTVGNAGIFRVSASRELEVLIRGITNIDLTIDVTGYWL